MIKVQKRKSVRIMINCRSREIQKRTIHNKVRKGSLMANNTIFDDVFRTMLEKMPELVIPLINEVFRTDYPVDIPIKQMRNEHHTKSGEIITDSRLLIADKMYHIECQSTSDSEMVIRMIEYDFAISLENVEKENGRYRIYFPHSCVLYLRGNRKNNVLGLDIVMPDGRILEYNVPALYVEQYTKDIIFQKKLLFLLPYYVIRYEKNKMTLKDDVKLRELLEEYKEIEKYLEKELLDEGKEVEYRYFIELISQIADYIFTDVEKAKKGIGKIMGGKVLELETDRIIREGLEKGMQQGMQQGMQRGMQQGIRETRIKIVTRMLKAKKYTLEEISSNTELPLNEIIEIKKELNL